MEKIDLSCLAEGERCVIQALGLYSGQRRRLRDLGLRPGVEVTCAHIAPAGSPRAFWVKGALIALRTEDCRKIKIQ